MASANAPIATPDAPSPSPRGMRSMPDSLRRTRPGLDVAGQPQAFSAPTPSPHIAPAASTPDTPALTPPQAPTEATDWLGENLLAEQGLAMPFTDCVDCGTVGRNLSRLVPFAGIPLGGGGGGGGGLGGGISTPGLADQPPGNLIELNPRPGSGSNGSTGSGDPSPDPGGGDTTPPGNPDGNPPTITPGGPTDTGPGGPDPRDPVSVPEPSALLLASFGVAGYVIRKHRSSCRRG